MTELAGRTSIAIPFHGHITSEEVDYVAGALERALDETRSSKFFAERGL
ncbi:MAG: hypothetical protein BWY92_01596 [Firmicutes bacterium ADurb.BinA052]|nr:MAG: hypothetical protein BWY92_01596 [Firmicutes bacterium ADurb.BinA052]